MKNLRKILLVIVLVFSSVLLVGCNETVSNENSVTLYLADSYKEMIKYE